ncbi:MAG: sulfate transporter CysZ [Desulfuromonas sp.]|nr:sulfate transporter CysZ [Desulfuromonas sp.]
MNIGEQKSVVVGSIRGFVGGFFSVWEAFHFVLKNPSLYKYVAIPLVINIVVFSAAIYWGFDLFSSLTGQYLSAHDAWFWQVLVAVVKFIAAVITLVVVFFAFTVVGNLIAAPFNDVLSERTEQLLTGNLVNEPFSLAQFAKDIGRVMLDEVRKMSIFIILMLVALLFNFLPGVGSMIYAVLSVGLTLYFLIIEYTGYVFGRKHLGFKDQRRFVANNRLGALGFALAVMCMLFIPFVQFLTIPIAVVAATQLCCSKELVG